MKNKVNHLKDTVKATVKNRKSEIAGSLACASIGLKVGGLGVAGGFGAFGIPVLVVVSVAGIAGVGVGHMAKKYLVPKKLL